MAGPAGYPITFAHRGARLERPENTLAAFSKALALGATGLETDAWLTADGVVVLHHDGRTGLPWRRRSVEAAARAELPRRVPSFADLVGLGIDGVDVSIDLKSPGTLGPIAAQARRAGIGGQLWLCHPDWRFLSSWRSRAPDVRLVNSTRQASVVEGVPERVAALAAAGIDAFNLPADEWSEPLVDAVHDAGLRAFGWGAQRRAAIDRLLELGVDGIYSDHVRRLVRRARQAAGGRTRPAG